MKLPTYPSHLHLPAMASWPESVHVFDDHQRNALRAAEAAGRPLLVRGEPGTGKSQLAHAAAVAARRRFIPFVVDSRTEPGDLLFSYDAVARLADAQLAGAARSSGDDRPALNAALYLSPGPLWWAFDPVGAQRQLDEARVPALAPEPPPADWQWTSADGTVLLIDEIDKAESELPNGLLEALGNGRFALPQAGRTVARGHGAPNPLVIVTSNEERELPPAFLRRCLVLTLLLPEGDALLAHLQQRAAVHFPAFASQHPAVVRDAAALLLEDRRQAREDGVYASGLAEFLDMLRALQEIDGDPAPQLELLRGYLFRKQPRAEA